MLKGEGCETVIPHALSRALPLCIVKMKELIVLALLVWTQSIRVGPIACYQTVLYVIV